MTARSVPSSRHRSVGVAARHPRPCRVSRNSAPISASTPLVGAPDVSVPNHANPPPRFERAVFEALVAPHVEAMQAAARRIVKSDDLAWDAVQDVLLRVWQRGWLPGEPGGALRHLVLLAALQVLRGRARRERHEDAACRAAAHRAEGECPRSAAEALELRRDLSAALAELPPDQVRVFELFELEGHDYACIAEKLELPVGTVRSRLSRARAALRRQLEVRLSSPEQASAPDSTSR